jgi:hypothetical protein
VLLNPVSIEVERLEYDLFDAQDAGTISDFLKQNNSMTQLLLHGDQYPNRDVLADRMFSLTKDPFVDTLFMEAVNAFNQPKFETEMSRAITWLQYYFPEAKTPKVQTVVTGLYNDLVVTDELIIIGLDFFIGADASYRPMDIPQYILKRYNQNFLTSTVLKFLVSSYATSGEETSLLSEMIDYGKVYYLLGKIMPCTPDDLIIGYEPQEIVDVYAYQELIWARIIEQEVLYSTDEFTKKKFIGERPNVYELGDDCPGRIGAWIGWQIVKHYMDKTNASMQELMENRNHHEIFTTSGYKPKNIR